MGVYQIFALLAALLPQRVFDADGTMFARAGSRRPWAAFVAAAVLVAVFVGYLLSFDRAVVEVHSASTVARLPLHFLNVIGGESALAPRADQLMLLALAEAVALGAFLFHLGSLGTQARRVTVGIVAVAFAIGALATQAVDSADPYFYVGLASLGPQAYSPPALPFGGDLHAVNAIWGTPMFASPYGPVWIAVSALLIAPFGTLAAKLFALKVLGLASVVVCAYLARRLGAVPEIVAGILCNPALYLAYVASAHNDLFGVDLVLMAALAARRSVVLAFAFALAASLAKPTLLFVAVIAFVALPSLRARASLAALLALAVAAVYAMHGGLLWHDLTTTVGAFAHTMTPFDAAFRVAVEAIALASSAWIVYKGRVWAQTAWAPPAFGAFALPSYSVWGLPLALASTPVAAVYLVTLPFLSFFECTALPITGTLNLAGDAFVLATVLAVAIRLRPGRSARPRASSSVQDPRRAGR
jgi:hypothetical protein